MTTIMPSMITRIIDEHGFNAKFSLSTQAQIEIENGLDAFNRRRKADGLSQVSLVFVPASASSTPPGEHSISGFEFREVKE